MVNDLGPLALHNQVNFMAFRSKFRVIRPKEAFNVLFEFGFWRWAEVFFTRILWLLTDFLVGASISYLEALAFGGGKRENNPECVSGLGRLWEAGLS